MVRVALDSFDDSYRRDDDPWDFATSPYELAKYDQTIRALSSSRYRRCFEPACSIGVLTERLAARADVVVGCDVSARAIEVAKRRLGDRTGIELRLGAIPEWWPDGEFDLVVLSELGYYWNTQGWLGIVDRVLGSLSAGGEIVAVHWLGESADHLLSGQAVHRALTDVLGASDVHLEQIQPGSPIAAIAARTGFVLDRWSAVQRRG